jgi:carboxymethylenebutenolidase
VRTALTAFMTLVLTTALACRRSPTDPGTTTTPGDDASKPTPQMGDTGVLDEASFKRLHELRDDRAPPARGVEIEIAGSKAYLSLPESSQPPLPAVVVIHEWWGLTDHIRHWTDRLAADGYAALAVDLYGGQTADDPDDANKLMKAVDEARAQEILSAAHRFLREDPRVAAKHRGVIGWCFGGGWSLRHAIATPDLDAAVIYYGRLVVDEAQLAKIGADLLGVFGNRDQGIPPQSVDEFVAAMKRAGKTVEVHRYDAEHGFANPSGARYDEASAGDAWEHVRAFLRKHLKQRASAPSIETEGP